MTNEIIGHVDAKAAIDRLTHAFFDLFENRNGRIPNLALVYDLFIQQGLVIKGVGQPPEVSNLTEFITPRQALLTDGSLTEFFEQELSESTLIFGNIAHRVCTYQKSGVLHGTPFFTLGMKSIQFVHTPQGWRISIAAWDDERDGLKLTQASNAGLQLTSPGIQ